MQDDVALDRAEQEKMGTDRYNRRKEAEIAKLEADAELVRAQARFTNAQAQLQEQSAEANKLIQQLQRLQITREIETFNNGGSKPASC